MGFREFRDAKRVRLCCRIWGEAMVVWSEFRTAGHLNEEPQRSLDAQIGDRHMIQSSLML